MPINCGTGDSSRWGARSDLLRVTRHFCPRFDATSGAASITRSRVDGIVFATAADGAGDWFVGGLFTSVDGVARSHLAHITATGQLDAAFDPSPTGRIYSMVRVGSTLNVGGE